MPASLHIEPSAASSDSDALPGRRILVTGGAGFLGAHVVTRLVLAGANVHVLDNMSTGRPENLTAARSAGLAKRDITVADIRDPRCVRTILAWKPDTVIHLAAQTSSTAATRDPVFDAEVNIRGSLKVFESCRAAGVGRVIFAASAAIYGDLHPDQLPATESQPIAPITPHGLSKATALHYLELLHRQGLPYTALALGDLYGPEQSNPGVVESLAGAVVRGERPQIVGDGDQTSDFVHVADAACAVLAACKSPACGLINIASGHETSALDVLDTVRRAAGGSVIVPQFEPTMPGEARRMVLDIRAGQRLLGWHPTTLLDEGIVEVIHWHRQHPEKAA